MNLAHIDSPSRINEIRQTISKKPALNAFYSRAYKKLKCLLNDSCSLGKIIELGSGGSFVNEFVPNAIRTDVIPYSGVDYTLDATNMSEKNESVKCFFLMNTLHHINDCEKFFKECDRCLLPGGLIYIVDQYPSFHGKLIYKYFHSEWFDMKSQHWGFPAAGPLSGANGALAWIIFFRDRQKFIEKFPNLKILDIHIHTPFLYWLTGGLKKWNLIPHFMLPVVLSFDFIFSKIFKKSGCFIDIIIQKVE